MENQYKRTVEGSMHEALLNRLLKVGNVIRDAIPDHFAATRRWSGPARQDLPLTVYVECEGYAYADNTTKANLIVMITFDPTTCTTEVRMSYGDDTNRAIHDRRTFALTEAHIAEASLEMVLRQLGSVVR